MCRGCCRYTYLGYPVVSYDVFNIICKNNFAKVLISWNANYESGVDNEWFCSFSFMRALIKS